jgi:hypothetical protein
MFASSKRWRKDQTDKSSGQPHINELSVPVLAREVQTTVAVQALSCVFRDGRYCVKKKNKRKAMTSASESVSVSVCRKSCDVSEPDNSAAAAALSKIPPLEPPPLVILTYTVHLGSGTVCD